MPDELEITPEALDRLLTTRPPALLDVREPWEFDIAHLPGSILLRAHDLTALMPALRAAELVVTVCHHGIRSYAAAAYLKDQGVARVQSLSGGLDEWSRRIDPTMPRY